MAMVCVLLTIEAVEQTVELSKASYAMTLMSWAYGANTPRVMLPNGMHLVTKLESPYALILN